MIVAHEVVDGGVLRRAARSSICCMTTFVAPPQGELQSRFNARLSSSNLMAVETFPQIQPFVHHRMYTDTIMIAVIP